MSITENIINQLSSQGIGNITKPQGFDLNDLTFAKLLEKSMSAQNVDAQQGNLAGGIGVPAGFIIEPFDAPQDLKPVAKINEQVEIKDVDMGNDYFSSILRSEPKEHKDLMNFAKKQASNLYKVFNKDLVTDIAELASDIAGKL